MSILSKIKNKYDEIVGGFKESVGEAYGNQALELDGEAEADAAQERDEAEAAQEREEADATQKREASPEDRPHR